MSDFFNRYGPWAVVTGAAQGLGQALAKECASLGLNLILTDLLETELQQTAAQISSSSPVEIKVVVADLNNPLQLKHLLQECEPYKIGLFCCNHGILCPGGKLKFWINTPLKDLHQMLQINLSSSIELLFFFAEKMRTLNRGGLVIISSGYSSGGAPYMAQYAATKAFLTSLGETLWWELKQSKIDVITSIPGLMKTPGVLKHLNSLGRQKMQTMSPNEVARITLAHLGKGPRVIPGWKNKLQAFLITYIFPRTWNLSFIGKIFPHFFYVQSLSKEEGIPSSPPKSNQEF